MNQEHHEIRVVLVRLRVAQLRAEPTEERDRGEIDGVGAEQRQEGEDNPEEFAQSRTDGGANPHRAAFELLL